MRMQSFIWNLILIESLVSNAIGSGHIKPTLDSLIYIRSRLISGLIKTYYD